jgi:hypothetical protein
VCVCVYTKVRGRCKGARRRRGEKKEKKILRADAGKEETMMLRVKACVQRGFFFPLYRRHCRRLYLYNIPVTDRVYFQRGNKMKYYRRIHTSKNFRTQTHASAHFTCVHKHRLFSTCIPRRNKLYYNGYDKLVCVLRSRINYQQSIIHWHFHATFSFNKIKYDFS